MPLIKHRSGDAILMPLISLSLSLSLSLSSSPRRSIHVMHFGNSSTEIDHTANRHLSERPRIRRGSNVQVRGKVDPVNATKVYRGSRGIASLILNFGLRWRSPSNSRPGRFTPGRNSGNIA